MGEEGGGARRGAQLSAHLRSQAVDFCTTVQPLDLGLEELQSVGETLLTRSGLQSWTLLQGSSRRPSNHLTHILLFNYTNRFPKALPGKVQSASWQRQSGTWSQATFHWSPPHPHTPLVLYLLQILKLLREEKGQYNRAFLSLSSDPAEKVDYNQDEIGSCRIWAKFRSLGSGGKHITM